jgi:hypothetical protein
MIVAFGTLFSNIKIHRENRDPENPVSQLVNVPIAYAPKEKSLVRLEQDPTSDKYVYITLPRMSFEITSVTYDETRRVNKGSVIKCFNDEGELSAVFAPAPYNIGIALYAISKSTEDGLQIAEQILPYFTPELNLKIKIATSPNIELDVPISLEAVDMEDSYSGDFQTRRFVIWTFRFVMKTNFFGPASTQGVITSVNVNIGDMDNPGNIFTSLTGSGDPLTGTVNIFDWDDNLTSQFGV